MSGYAQRVSVSLPEVLYAFVESYQKEQHLQNRSQVIAEALLLLQQKQLEACYREDCQQNDTKKLLQDFDGVSRDGIDDEAW